MARKQTILTVPTPDLKPAPAMGWHHVTRNAYSIDGYAPVLVTISVRSTTAILKTTTLPGGSVWREPNAALRRILLDEVLVKHNMIRTGTVDSDGWTHRYPIRALNTPHPECPIRSVVHDEHVFKHFGNLSDPSTGAHIDCAGR